MRTNRNVDRLVRVILDPRLTNGFVQIRRGKGNRKNRWHTIHDICKLMTAITNSDDIRMAYIDLLSSPIPWYVRVDYR